MASTTHSAIPAITLNDGLPMPQLGYGVWQVAADEASKAVQAAIAVGYRSIDTAMIYDNEQGVGQGIQASGVAREELFVTTKLWNSDHLDAHAAFETSLNKLGLHYVDLYLIHWPALSTGDYRRAWETLVKLREAGQARSIGVSNFEIEHLEQIIADTGVGPALNQIELHPQFQQHELREFHAQNGIATEAWSPLGRGGTLLTDPCVALIAADHGRTPAQVVLRWHMQIDNITIPKTVSPERMVENISVFDFALTPDQMMRLAALDDANGRLGPNPRTTAF